MLYQSLALFAVTLTSVSAFPTRLAKQDFVNDPNGNIRLTCTSDYTITLEGLKNLIQRPVSDAKIKLGTITIDEIVKNLAAACSTDGQCDTSPI